MTHFVTEPLLRLQVHELRRYLGQRPSRFSIPELMTMT